MGKGSLDGVELCAHGIPVGVVCRLFLSAAVLLSDRAPAARLRYADAADARTRSAELERVRRAVVLGNELGLQVNAGHGLDYHNVKAVAAIPGVRELNIGHAIVARAIFSGLANAVADMKRLINGR